MRHFLSILLTSFSVILLSNNKVDSLLNAVNDNFKIHNWALAAELVENAHDLAAEQNYSLGIVRSINYEGWVYEKTGEMAEAVKSYLKVIELTKTSNDPDLLHFAIYSHLNLGNIFKHNGAMDLALNYYSTGLDLARNTASKKEELSFLRNIHIFYRVTGDYDQALTLAHEIFLLTPVNSDKYFEMLNGLGITHQLAGQHVQAEYYYKKLLDESIKADKSKYVAFALHNLGDVYFQMNDFELSKAYFLKSIAYKEEIGDLGPEREHVSFRDLARTLVHLNNLEEAQKQLLISETYLAKIPDCMDCSLKIYELGLEIAQRFNDLQLVDHYQAKQLMALEEIENNKLLVNYANRQSELRLVVDNYYAEFQSQQEAQSYKDLLFSVIAAFASLILLLAGYHLYGRYRIKKTLSLELQKLKWDN